MANRSKDFFGRIANFEEAMRKFEAALEQSLEESAGQRPGQARGPAGQRPPQGRPPMQPDADQRARMANPPPGYRDARDEPYGDERADFLRRIAEAAETYGERPSGGRFNHEDRDDEGHSHEGFGSEGFGDEGSLGQEISSGSDQAGISLEGGPMGDPDLTRSVSTSRPVLMSLAGTAESTGSAWQDDPYSRGRASGTMPSALAHLDRYQNPLVQGIIWAEVLGRPVSKRRGRGRFGF